MSSLIFGSPLDKDALTAHIATISDGQEITALAHMILRSDYLKVSDAARNHVNEKP